MEIASIYQYYARWIREGKLKVNSDWNKDLKIKFTAQDPCQIVRKSFGEHTPDAEHDHRTKLIVLKQTGYKFTPALDLGLNQKSVQFICGLAGDGLNGIFDRLSVKEIKVHQAPFGFVQQVGTDAFDHHRKSNVPSGDCHFRILVEKTFRRQDNAEFLEKLLGFGIT